MSKRRPIKLFQFGEGNFLRAFVDFAFHKLNNELDFNGGIALLQPIEKGLVDVLNQQEGRYTFFQKEWLQVMKLRKSTLLMPFNLD